MASAGIIKLEIPSSAEFVIIARKAVEGVVSGTPLTNEQVEDLKLAVGEACTNAVKFSSPGKPAVRVLYRLEPDRIEIEVHNTGSAFPKSKLLQARPSLDQLPDNGLGLYLIDQVMDEMNISSRRGVTTLKMAKRFAPAV